MECKYPQLKPRSSYNKGCKCERCLEGVRAQFRAFKAANPDKVKGYQAQVKLKPRRRATLTYHSSRWHAKLKGHMPVCATIEEIMFAQQSTTCCHCGSGGKLHTDHCHETGTLRGMLCSSCNRRDVLGHSHSTTKG